MGRRKVAALPAAKLKLIHVAKRRLRMEDDDYRTVLRRVAGVESAKDLTEAKFHQVMEVFATLGFTSDSAAFNFGRREGFATPGQVAAIRRLWAIYTGGEGTDATLGHWLTRTWHVSALRFLPEDKAKNAIIVLRGMCRRRGAAAPKVA